MNEWHLCMYLINDHLFDNNTWLGYASISTLEHLYMVYTHYMPLCTVYVIADAHVVMHHVYVHILNACTCVLN